MLDECRAVFAERLKEKGERLILDSYIPAEGTYLIVERDGSVGSITDLVKDKKTKEIDCSSLRASDLFYYDYYSQLISMNKPMDVKKIIHSNSYLSFFVKKESFPQLFPSPSQLSQSSHTMKLHLTLFKFPFHNSLAPPRELFPTRLRSSEVRMLKLF